LPGGSNLAHKKRKKTGRNSWKKTKPTVSKWVSKKKTRKKRKKSRKKKSK